MQEGPTTRRSFLFGASAKTVDRICPPGTSPASLQACTGCGLCVERCPSGIIGLMDGWPALEFTSGECTFCGECGLACPEPVFAPEPVQRFSHTATVTDACLARRDVACQSCGESCPANAIRFSPRLGGPFLPDLDEERCTGCGACLQVCPVGAIAMKSQEVELCDV
jgi:ferredoxin-type protein NapF